MAASSLTFQLRQRLNFTVLLVDVETRAHLPAILFDERPRKIHALCDGRRRWSVVVIRCRWGCGDGNAGRRL